MLKKNKFISNLTSPIRQNQGIINWMLLSGCLFVFIAACNHTKPDDKLDFSITDSAFNRLKNERANTAIQNAKPIIHTGDMILRTGNDFTSESLRQLSFTDKTYSHCGIASIENDTVFVYHALGGEWNPDEKLRRDPLELFCNPLENRGFGIFSFNLNKYQVNKLDSIVKAWYDTGLMFDMKFDLSTDDKLYCAEFVSKAVSECTNSSIIFPISRLNKFEFVAVDNLFLNNHCLEKKRTRYQ